MDRISTREARGWGVGVCEAVEVGVGVSVGVKVAVCVAVGDTVEVGTTGNGAPGFGIWQASTTERAISGMSLAFIADHHICIYHRGQWVINLINLTINWGCVVTLIKVPISVSPALAGVEGPGRFTVSVPFLS